MLLLIYLLKLVFCTALFYGYYRFFLRDKQFHQYNRFYLLAAVAFSILLPMIKFPVTWIGGESNIAKSINGVGFDGWEKEVILTASNNYTTATSYSLYVFIVIYITGLLVALYPVIKSLGYIKSLARESEAKELYAVKFYNTSAPGTPFSFFNQVFWNNNISIETEEGQQILRHEIVHVRQKHSYDILFVQLASAALWFNPFYYLFKRELKIVHEYLADEYAISATNRYQYAELLVTQSVAPKQIFISNQFFYNQIKRRITMILKNNPSRYSNARKMMAGPLLFVLVCACSLKSKDETLASIDKKVEYIAPPVSTKPEIEASFPGGRDSWMRFLAKTCRYPQEAQEQEIQGKVVMQFVVERDGSISNVRTADHTPGDDSNTMVVVAYKNKNSKIEQIKASGDQSAILEKEAARIIAASGKWIPASNKGVAVASLKKQPISFKLEAQ